jgi:accessory colonization factor AcfC
VLRKLFLITSPGIAQVVNLEPRYRLYRDCGIALTSSGQANPTALKFTDPHHAN